MSWTDADLERFLDDDLEPDRRTELAEALRSDGALRARLGAIIEADALMRGALLAVPAPAAATTGRRPIRGQVWRVCAAAALVIAASGAWWALRPGAPGAPRLPGSPASEVEMVAADTPEEIHADLLAAARSHGLLVAIVPGGARRERVPRPELAPSERLLVLLDRGELDGALAMIRGQPADLDSGPLWKTFGQRLSSGQAAQEVLMSLPEARQVEVCRAWADEPTLRPVTFVWLARLGASDDAAVREAVASLRSELEQRPELRAWLQSYASAAP